VYEAFCVFFINAVGEKVRRDLQKVFKESCQKKKDIYYQKRYLFSDSHL